MELWKGIVLLNGAAIILMGYDKYQARRGKWRVSEAALLTVAALLGAAGIWAGMYLFRHKTKHALFKYGVPFLLSLNILLVYYLLDGNW